MQTNHSSNLIILAGGKSERMGTPKGLLTYKDSYWVLEQIKRFSVVDDATVFIGLGYDYQYYFKAIPWFKKAIDEVQIYSDVKVRVVINKQPENGLFSTLQTVLTKIEPSKSVLVLPIDVPLLKAKELHKILEVQNKIIILKYNGKDGHPVKLQPTFWTTLLRLPITDSTARLDVQIRISSEENCTYVDVNDAQILHNLNTVKEWNDFLKA